MSDIVIKVENLGKRYRIGGRQKAHDTLRDSIMDAANEAYQGVKNILRGHVPGGGSEDYWALKDVSFEVKRGDVVGIIGRNGAGKSTLLKILSRITEPTEGRATLHGRLSSLLEVGTGFHSELTGRENIYLSGSILGMTKKEINRKFDEIVDFSEIEKFLDTPVKRYSSGMYLRLGFAVAAHLEPEILIVDEVLAVGDAEFQKKCLGKMNDASKDGRTVLLVSHNLTTIESLADHVIVMDKGQIQTIAPTDEGISHYVESIIKRTCVIPLDERIDRKGNGDSRITEFWLENDTGQPVNEFVGGKPGVMCFKISSEREIINADIAVSVHKMDLSPLFRCSSRSSNKIPVIPVGESIWRCRINRVQLIHGSYPISLIIRDRSNFILDYISQSTILEITGGDFYGNGFSDLHSPFLIDNQWIMSASKVNLR